SHDGEPKPETLAPIRPVAVALPEALEDVRQRIRRDADSVVTDLELDAPIGPLGERDVDLTAPRGELDGIGEQVPRHLLEPGRIAGPPGVRRIEAGAQLPLTRLRRRAHRLHRLREDRRDLHGPHVEAELARYDARNVEQVVDELGEHRRVALDDLDRATALLRVDLARPQQASPGEDG